MTPTERAALLAEGRRLGREEGSTEGWKDALDAAWRAMAEPYYGEGADSARARGIKFGREESCRRVDGMRAQIRRPQPTKPGVPEGGAPTDDEAVDLAHDLALPECRGDVHVGTCRHAAQSPAPPPSRPSEVGDRPLVEKLAEALREGLNGVDDFWAQRLESWRLLVAAYDARPRPLPVERTGSEERALVLRWLRRFWPRWSAIQAIERGDHIPGQAAGGDAKGDSDGK